jgi:hypothetical protein
MKNKNINPMLRRLPILAIHRRLNIVNFGWFLVSTMDTSFKVFCFLVSLFKSSPQAAPHFDRLRRNDLGALTPTPSVNVPPELIGTFHFDLSDLSLQPLLNFSYRLPLVALELKFVDRVPRVIKGDEMTRDSLRVILRANEIK